jgi:decaprenylphospho-beta-D-erythro-pentofuranosid-2-ulose 2-reductase
MENSLGAVQSALILGGGSEIAQAIACKLVDGGCRTVVLAGRRPTDLADAAKALETRGATNVDTVEFDARDIDSHEKVVASAFERHGDIDLVLIAFGVLGHGAGIDLEPAAAAEIATTNYVGAVSSGLAAAHRLRDQGHGVIVVLSSVAGERPRKSNFVYGSSKAGLDAFAQGLGDALVGSGVRVLIVRPGFVHTKMTEGLEAKALATTADAVADSVIAGLGSHKEVVWVPNTFRWVMSGFRHLPRPLWRKVSANL